MNPEQAKHYWNHLDAQERALSTAEHRAENWRAIAIAVAFIALYCILRLYGFLPD